MCRSAKTEMLRCQASLNKSCLLVAHHLNHAYSRLQAWRKAEVRGVPLDRDYYAKQHFNTVLCEDILTQGRKTGGKVHSPLTLTLCCHLALTHLSGGLLRHTGLPHHGFPRSCLFQKKGQPLALQGFRNLHHDPWMCLPPHWIQLPVGGAKNQATI